MCILRSDPWAEFSYGQKMYLRSRKQMPSRLFYFDRQSSLITATILLVEGEETFT